MTYITLEESAYGVSFFQRLETNDRAHYLLDAPNLEDILNSIKLNLTQLLNANLGEAQSNPELGLIDFNDAASSSNDLILHLRRAIKQTIERYEPRLSNVVVGLNTDENNPLNLCFSIQAYINACALHKQVEIELLLDNSKQYRVF